MRARRRRAVQARLAYATPADTGRLRGNWQTTINTFARQHAGYGPRAAALPCGGYGEHGRAVDVVRVHQQPAVRREDRHDGRELAMPPEGMAEDVARSRIGSAKAAAFGCLIEKTDAVNPYTGPRSVDAGPGPVGARPAPENSPLTSRRTRRPGVGRASTNRPASRPWARTARTRTTASCRST